MIEQVETRIAASWRSGPACAISWIDADPRPAEVSRSTARGRRGVLRGQPRARPRCGTVDVLVDGSGARPSSGLGRRVDWVAVRGSSSRSTRSRRIRCRGRRARHVDLHDRRAVTRAGGPGRLGRDESVIPRERHAGGSWQESHPNPWAPGTGRPGPACRICVGVEGRYVPVRTSKASASSCVCGGSSKPGSCHASPSAQCPPVSVRAALRVMRARLQARRRRCVPLRLARAGLPSAPLVRPSPDLLVWCGGDYSKHGSVLGLGGRRLTPPRPRRPRVAPGPSLWRRGTSCRTRGR